ncbi:hypothetical protein RF11_15353 [Thelohanellus kitauei]|uniref:MHD domain-containing protein n=1 Tax=Thelohanellus kitauei TaxID=669202 RepID=A0A0C2LZW5_THEKT|nr:hypothetical protein RF11_15353 [Thelohanellus kitauei]
MAIIQENNITTKATPAKIHKKTASNNFLEEASGISKLKHSSQTCLPIVKSKFSDLMSWSLYVKFDQNINRISKVRENDINKWFVAMVQIELDYMNIFHFVECQETCYQIFLCPQLELVEIYTSEPSDFDEMSETCLGQFVPLILPESKSHEAKKGSFNFIYFRSKSFNSLRSFREITNEIIKFSCHFINQPIFSVNNNLKSKFGFQVEEFSEFTISSTGRLENTSTTITMKFTHPGITQSEAQGSRYTRGKFTVNENEDLSKNNLNDRFINCLHETNTHEICKNLRRLSSQNTFNFAIPSFYGQINLIKYQGNFFKSFPIKVRGIFEIYSENTLEISIDVHPFKTSEFLPLGCMTLRIQFPDTWAALFKNNKTKDKSSYINIKANKQSTTFKNEKCTFTITNGNAFYKKSASSIIWKLDWLNNFHKYEYTHIPIEFLKCHILVPFEIKRPKNFHPFVEVESEPILTPNPILRLNDVILSDYNISTEIGSTSIQYSKRFRLKYYMALKEDGELIETFKTYEP